MAKRYLELQRDWLGIVLNIGGESSGSMGSRKTSSIGDLSGERRASFGSLRGLESTLAGGDSLALSSLS